MAPKYLENYPADPQGKISMGMMRLVAEAKKGFKPAPADFAIYKPSLQ